MILGHKASNKVLEVNQAILGIVSSLSPLISMKCVRSFLGHFISNLSMIFPKHLTYYVYCWKTMLHLVLTKKLSWSFWALEKETNILVFTYQIGSNSLYSRVLCVWHFTLKDWNNRLSSCVLCVPVIMHWEQFLIKRVRSNFSLKLFFRWFL